MALKLTISTFIIKLSSALKLRNIAWGGALNKQPDQMHSQCQSNLEWFLPPNQKKTKNNRLLWQFFLSQIQISQKKQIQGFHPSLCNFIRLIEIKTNTKKFYLTI